MERVQQFIFKVLLFLSSYIPLSIILFIKNIDHFKVSVIILIVLIYTPLTIIKRYIDIPIKRGQANKDIKIISYNNIENQMLNYISGYIIPLIAFNNDVITKEGVNYKELLIVIILFSVIGYLYMKTNIYYINPVLSIFYNIYSVNTERENGLILLLDRNKQIEINRVVFVRKVSPGTSLLTDKKCQITGVKIFILMMVLIILLIFWNKEVRNSLMKIIQILFVKVNTLLIK